MRTVPANLLAHYALTTSKVATGLRIIRKDGITYGFTNASDSVTIGGVLYSASQGLNIQSLVSTSGLNVDNLEIRTGNDGSLFTNNAILAGTWDNASFIIFQYNWLTPSDGVDILVAGTFGNVTIEGTQVVVELRGLQQALQQNIGKVISATCRTYLGSPQCRVNIAPFTRAGTVTAVTSNKEFTGGIGTYYLDPYFTSSSLILDFEGTDAAVSTTDYSINTKTATFYGNAQIDTAQFARGTSSLLLDGTGDAISFPDNAEFEFGSGDFTIEFWLRPSQVASSKYILGKINGSNYGGIIFYQAGSSLLIYMSSTGSSWDIVNNLGIGTMTVDTWYHVAVARQGTVLRTFLNGVLTTSTVITQSLVDTTTALYIGAANAALTTPFQGHIDDLRITKGVARYLDTFTVGVNPNPTTNVPTDTSPTEPLDWFTEGYITWVTGLNAGHTKRIKSYTAAGVITLVVGLWNNVQVGDTFTIVAGCRKRLIEDCQTKFDNVLNFDGEPHLPGIDKITERIIT